MNKEVYLALNQKLTEENVTLIAVSKTKPMEDIQAVYDLGHRQFGENRAKELQLKAEALPKDIEWHMIGHMQSNKVKYLAPYVFMVHSVDSISLLDEIQKRAKQNDRIIRVLLQVHIAEEQTKYGFDEQGIVDIVSSKQFSSYENIQICGLMGMATFTDNQKQVRKEFTLLKTIFDRLKSTVFAQNDEFKTLSMGMSGDYEIAIEEGSNMVRIGSKIFGARG